MDLRQKHTEVNTRPFKLPRLINLPPSKLLLLLQAQYALLKEKEKVLKITPLQRELYNKLKKEEYLLNTHVESTIPGSSGGWVKVQVPLKYVTKQKDGTYKVQPLYYAKASELAKTLHPERYGDMVNNMLNNAMTGAAGGVRALATGTLANTIQGAANTLPNLSFEKGMAAQFANIGLSEQAGATVGLYADAALAAAGAADAVNNMRHDEVNASNVTLLGLSMLPVFSGVLNKIVTTAKSPKFRARVENPTSKPIEITHVTDANVDDITKLRPASDTDVGAYAVSNPKYVLQVAESLGLDEYTKLKGVSVSPKTQIVDWGDLNVMNLTSRNVPVSELSPITNEFDTFKWNLLNKQNIPYHIRKGDEWNIVFENPNSTFNSRDAFFPDLSDEARRSLDELNKQYAALKRDEHGLIIDAKKALELNTKAAEILHNENKFPMYFNNTYEGGEAIVFYPQDVYSTGYPISLIPSPSPATGHIGSSILEFNDNKNTLKNISSKKEAFYDRRNNTSKKFSLDKQYPENSRTIDEHVKADIERGILSTDDDLVYFDLSKISPELASVIDIKHNPIGMFLDGKFYPSFGLELYPQIIKNIHGMDVPTYGRGYITNNNRLTNYYNNVIRKLGENYSSTNEPFNFTKIPIYFGPGKKPFWGFYNPFKKVVGLNTAQRSEEYNYINTLLHELFSHGTDEMYPEALKEYQRIANGLKDLDDGISKAPKGASFKREEVRATLNEAGLVLEAEDPSDLALKVDRLSDDQFLNLIYNINGYGRDYVNILDNARINHPKEYNHIIKQLRWAMKTLPVVTGGALLSNNSNKTHGEQK